MKLNYFHWKQEKKKKNERKLQEIRIAYWQPERLAKYEFNDCWSECLRLEMQ